MKRLLIMSGPIASGKTVVADALREEFNFTSLSSSTYLREHAEKCGVQILGRSELQDLGDQLDISTDYSWVVENVARVAINKDPLTENWLLDAVRKPRQVEHFRIQFKLAVRHVHLSAPEQILQQRWNSRRRPEDLDYHEACLHPNEIAARGLGTYADLVLDTNNEALEQVIEKILNLWEE